MKGDFYNNSCNRIDDMPRVKLVSFDEVYEELDLNIHDYVNRIGKYEDLEIEKLKESIKANKLINPPTVKRQANGTYIKVAGFRRLLAMQELWDEGYSQADLDLVVKVVSEKSTEEELKAISFAENNCRKDLEKWEVLNSFRKDSKTMTTEQLMRVYDIGEAMVSKYRTASNTLEYLSQDEIDDFGMTTLSKINVYINKVLKGKTPEEIKAELQKLKGCTREEIVAKTQEKSEENNKSKKVNFSTGNLNMVFDSNLTKEELLKKLFEEVEKLKKIIEEK